MADRALADWNARTTGLIDYGSPGKIEGTTSGLEARRQSQATQESVNRITNFAFAPSAAATPMSMDPPAPRPTFWSGDVHTPVRSRTDVRAKAKPAVETSDFTARAPTANTPPSMRGELVVSTQGDSLWSSIAERLWGFLKLVLATAVLLAALGAVAIRLLSEGRGGRFTSRADQCLPVAAPAPTVRVGPVVAVGPVGVPSAKMTEERIEPELTGTRISWLGVGVENVTPEMGLRRTRGVVVRSVARGSRAAGAHIQPGDVISGMGPTSIENVEDLVRVPTGEDELSVTILRADGDYDYRKIPMGSTKSVSEP